MFILMLAIGFLHQPLFDNSYVCFLLKCHYLYDTGENPGIPELYILKLEETLLN